MVNSCFYDRYVFRGVPPSVDRSRNSTVAQIAVRGVSKMHYGSAIRLWPIAFHPRVTFSLLVIGGRRTVVFSRTIDPFGETFAINELLPVADTVQLPPADAFPQVPARFVRSWGELRPWAKPWGREGRRGGKRLLPFWEAASSRRERGKYTSTVRSNARNMQAIDVIFCV